MPGKYYNVIIIQVDGTPTPSQLSSSFSHPQKYSQSPITATIWNSCNCCQNPSTKIPDGIQFLPHTGAAPVVSAAEVVKAQMPDKAFFPFPPQPPLTTVSEDTQGHGPAGHHRIRRRHCLQQCPGKRRNRGAEHWGKVYVQGESLIVLAKCYNRDMFIPSILRFMLEFRLHQECNFLL